ncbi:MAG: LytTR family transcriptional regulator [Lachnospiraceae bacterium]|nr:LytTR family transcriptional regulator [Lachnospiraceae bacterium]MCR4684949.1 LytTR family transcriptional regulator [Lachnospiraceae bacterium]
MKNMVEIDVILDDKYVDPKVTIQTKTHSEQVENIIYAIENASENDFPTIVARNDDKLIFVSQRDIIRVHTQGRKVLLETEEGTLSVKRTLAGLEEDLNPKRFLRISQSEIINLYKVKCFDINMAGTIGVEFDNGTKSWASRSRVKNIKAMLKAAK